MNKSILILFFIFLGGNSNAQNFWKKIPSPRCFPGENILYDNDNNIYAQFSNGIFLSTNLGVNWQKIVNSEVGSFTIDSTGNLFFCQKWDSLVFISSNKGQTWEERNLPEPNGYLKAAGNKYCFYWINVYNLTGPRRDEKLYLSNDGCITWQSINLPAGGLKGSIDLNIFNNSDIILELLDSDLNYSYYYSNNWGKTWIKINTIDTGRLKVLPDKIFFMESSSRLCKSTNFGTSWESYNIDFPRIAFNPGMQDIFMAAADYNIGSYFFLKSTNYGETWDTLTTNFPMFYQFFLLNKNLIITDQLTYTTNQGKSWFCTSADGLPDVKISSICFDKSNLMYLNNFDNGLFTSSDSGTIWNWINDSYYGATDDNHDLYEHVKSGNWLKSTDGKDWKTIGNAGDFICFNKNNYIFTAGSAGIYYTTDQGLNWTTIITARLTSFAVNSNDYFFMTSDDPIYSGVYRSFDYGKTPFAKTSLTDPKAQKLLITSKNKIYVIVEESKLSSNPDKNPQILSSTDLGDTWNDETYNLETNEITSIIKDKNDQIFIGTKNDGVYTLKNLSKNWEELNNGLPLDTIGGSSGYPEIGCIAFDSYGYLYIETSEGIFKGNIYLGVENNVGFRPINYSLSQNFPNPFNPSTTIYYQIPQEGFVSLKVYDVLGKEVVSLVNEERPAGNYEVNFDGRELASGIYFYKIRAGNFTSVKKMILIK